MPDKNFTFEYLIVAPLSVNSCRVKMEIASCLNVTYHKHITYAWCNKEICIKESCLLVCELPILIHEEARFGISRTRPRHYTVVSVYIPLYICLASYLSSICPRKLRIVSVAKETSAQRSSRASKSCINFTSDNSLLSIYSLLSISIVYLLHNNELWRTINFSPVSHI